MEVYYIEFIHANIAPLYLECQLYLFLIIDILAISVVVSNSDVPLFVLGYENLDTMGVASIYKEICQNLIVILGLLQVICETSIEYLSQHLFRSLMQFVRRRCIYQFRMLIVFTRL